MLRRSVAPERSGAADLVGAEQGEADAGGAVDPQADPPAERMADASGVSIDLDARADEHELYGGEDHALLACFAGPVPEGFRVIGRVLPRGAAAVTVGGTVTQGRTGWDPLRDWDAGRG